MTPAQRHAIEAAKRLRRKLPDNLVRKIFDNYAFRPELAQPNVSVDAMELLTFADAIDALQQEEADGEAD